MAGNISNFYSVDNAEGAYDENKGDNVNKSNFSSGQARVNNSIKTGGNRNRSFSSFLSQ